MIQERIKYGDIMSLDFKEQIENDEVYFKEYGYHWAIITKKLTKNISLDWEKETQLCSMIRVNNKRDSDIMAKMPIMNLEHLKDIVEFFTSNKK